METQSSVTHTRYLISWSFASLRWAEMRCKAAQKAWISGDTAPGYKNTVNSTEFSCSVLPWFSNCGSRTMPQYTHTYFKYICVFRPCLVFLVASPALFNLWEIWSDMQVRLRSKFMNTKYRKWTPIVSLEFYVYVVIGFFLLFSGHWSTNVYFWWLDIVSNNKLY